LNIFWKILVVANLGGLIYLTIHARDENKNLVMKIEKLEQIGDRLLKETQDLKLASRDFIKISNQLKFRVERLEFESSGDYMESTELFQYSNIQNEKEDRELERDISYENREYIIEMQDEYCDIVKKSIITLVYSGFGELAYPCVNN